MTKNISSSLSDTADSKSMRSGWRDLDIHSYVKLFIMSGLIYFIFRNEIGPLVKTWATNSSWSHGFLIPLFSLYFMNQHQKELVNLKTKPNYLGLFLLIFVMLFYFFNLFSQAGYGYFRQTSVIGAVFAVALFLGGWSLIRYTWLPIFYLMFAVPLPQRYYFKMTYPMQELAANVATYILNLVKGVMASLEGVTIDVLYNGVKTTLNVEEACSGMRLLLAFLALGVAMAYLHYRPIWQRIILLVSTILVAIFCNIVRVTVTGFIYVLWNEEYAKGIYHDLLGLLMLPLAFGLYYLLAEFMENLFVEETHEVTEDIVVRRPREGN
ncbi:MAG: exosortase/archaeosortase family protein [Planctomycetota bacterium]|jgi:exosortase